MPIPFMVIMGVIGALYVAFAFVRPPDAIAHFFRVPGIFVFLPDRWILPVGRFVVGALILVGGVVLFLRTH